jgi:hypothetical protein
MSKGSFSPTGNRLIFFGMGVFLAGALPAAATPPTPATFEKLNAPVLTGNSSAPQYRQITGQIVSTQGYGAVITTRDGRQLQVDASEAAKRQSISPLVVGEPFTFTGSYGASGIFYAVAASRAKDSPNAWPVDQ